MKKETQNKKPIVKTVVKKIVATPKKTKEAVIIAVPKKTVVSKPIVVQKPKFITASEQQRFWVNNGPILKDLRELHDALLKMSREQYQHHTKKQNDFSLWVEYVLLDKKTAGELKKTKTQKDAVKVVAAALKK